MDKLNGIAIQMVHRNPKVRPQYTWPKGETPVLTDEQAARSRGVAYCDQVRRLLKDVGPVAKLETWQVQHIASIRVVRVENDLVVGEPIFSWSFGRPSVEQETAAAA